jgi:hypothetical protein
MTTFPTGPDLFEKMQNAVPETAFQANSRYLENKVLCPNGHTGHVLHLDMHISWAFADPTDKVVAGISEWIAVADQTISACGWCSTCDATWIFPNDHVAQRFFNWPDGKVLLMNDKNRAMCECGQEYELIWEQEHSSVYEYKYCRNRGHFYWDAYHDGESGGDETSARLWCTHCNIGWFIDSIPAEIRG